MAGFSFDAEAAQAQLERLIGECDGRQRAYQAQVPSFPSQAAGQGFASYGERIARMLQQVHEAGQARSSGFADGCRFARRMVIDVCDADDEFAHRLEGL